MTLETVSLEQTDLVACLGQSGMMSFCSGFLILTLANQLITDCCGIDLKFQPLEKLSHPLDSWPGGGRGRQQSLQR